MARILDWGMVCDRGRTRAENQDATLLWTTKTAYHYPAAGPPPAGDAQRCELASSSAEGDEGSALCAALVADGMGGQRGGDEASNLIAETVAGTLRKMTEPPTAEFLNELCGESNRRVFERAKDRGLLGMGSTATLLCLAGTRLLLCHVGDSRCYRLNRAEGSLQQWSEDQNIAAQLVAQGVLAPEKAMHHPSSHVLTQAVGLGKPLKPQINERDLAAEDEIYMLCSDGLLRVVTEREIEQSLTFAWTDPNRDQGDKPFLQQTAEDLLQLANERGSPDNVSIILLGLHAPDSRLRK